MNQLEGSASHDLDAIRHILLSGDVGRLEEKMTNGLGAAAAQLADAERRAAEQMEEVSHRITAVHEEMSRRQQEHTERVTQLLEQMVSQLGRRVDTLVTETRAALDDVKQRVVEVERRKLNVADFSGTLSTLGQRFSGDNGYDPFHTG